ncbi:LIM domain-containing protein [Desulfogranum japonicum]|uniref:hypothetical protein n=1 Tax=Desulfogranum japonicum TaxID=231447 RepID=UPI00048CF391|nr:hypothetical protein [Desulfogranum japonicum]
MELFLEKYGIRIAIAWVVIVALSWLIVRKIRPGLLGLGVDFNDQRIDGVKLRKCTKCNKGRLKPVFSKGQKFTLALPVTFYKSREHPEKFICTNCNFIIDRSSFDDKDLPFSLASKISISTPAKLIIIFLLIFFSCAIIILFFLGEI